MSALGTAITRSVEQTSHAANVSESDAIAPGTCLRCGFPGLHESAKACISVLRDRIATLEFRRGAEQRLQHPRRRRVAVRAEAQCH
jgi:hypothetical protein